METVTLNLGQFFAVLFGNMVLASLVTVVVMYGYFKGPRR